MNLANSSIDTLFQRAVDAHTAGKRRQAAELYLQILEIAPDHADSLHLLGVVHDESGDHATAIQLIGRAIEHLPYAAPFHDNLGLALRASGNLDAALASHEKAIELDSNLLSALQNRAVALHGLERNDEALAATEQTLLAQPAHCDALLLKGTLLRVLGDLPGSTAALESVLSLQPRNAAALNNLAITHRESGDLEQARDCYEQMLIDQPQSSYLLTNLGAIERQLGLNDAAIQHLELALSIDPEDSVAHHNLGAVWQARGQLEQAAQSYRRSLEINPDTIATLYNLGQVYADGRKWDLALPCFTQVFEADRSHPVAAHLLSLNCHRCDWEQLDELGRLTDQITLAGIRGEGNAIPPILEISRCMDPKRNYDCAVAWSKHLFPEVPAPIPWTGAADRPQRLKIAYCSNDFRNHPVAHLCSGLFGHHDRERFETIIVSYGEDDGSWYRERVKNSCDHWEDVCGLDADEILERIRALGVHVLVDLMGYTAGARLQIFAKREAPIQVTWLGYPGTSGADFFDYVVGDPTVSPVEHADYFSERLALMPHCYQVNDQEEPIADKPVGRADFGLPEDAFVFACFCQVFKIEPVMFDVWMRILERVPDSLLWVYCREEIIGHNLQREAQSRGVAPDRIRWSGRVPKDEHLQRLGLADLALDTRIYTGHTTTSDALWAGLPVVTARGEHFASRVSASILTAHGVPELACSSLDQFEELAVRLATHPDQLKAIRDRVQAHRTTHPLFDTRGFARDLEGLYDLMWQEYVTGSTSRSPLMLPAAGSETRDDG